MNRVIKKFLERLNPQLIERMHSINPFQILKQVYSLSDKEVKTIRSRFIKNKTFNNDLYIGQFRDEKPTLIIGAPCIRKDIEGISLNTFYQVFMPIKVASIIKVPCKIFLGVKEETIYQPKLFDSYRKLGYQIEKAIKEIANELKVDIEVVDTNSYRYDKLINECIEELDIQFSAEDSTYLFNLSSKRLPKPLHSTLRIISNKRVVACNTSSALKKLFGEYNYLIVEDVEQHVCTLFSRRFDKDKTPNFLAFLPLPNIRGTSTMFKSEKEERFLLERNRDYYKSIFEKSSPLAINIYEKIFNLFKSRKTNSARDFKLFLEVTEKISDYFYEQSKV